VTARLSLNIGNQFEPKRRTRGHRPRVQ